MSSVVAALFGSTVAAHAAAPPVPRDEVLAVGPRVVALKRYAEGTVDCHYPGLPAKAGRSIELVWDDGLHEAFPVQGAGLAADPDTGVEEVPCRTPAESASLQAVADRAMAGAGLKVGGPTAWYPRSDQPTTLAGGRVLTFTAAETAETRDEPGVTTTEVVVRIDGTPMARTTWARWLGVPDASSATVVLGLAEQGARAAAVFESGGGDPTDPLWIVPLDAAHPTSATAPVRPVAPLEIQAVDLQRGLFAYRRFTPARSGTCPYPGGADKGVVLGVASLRTHSAIETVVYDPPGNGSPCTSPEAAAQRLAAAKVRSTELGLERVVGGAPGCRTGSGEWRVDGHVLRSAAGTGVTWDGVVLTPQPDGAVVCVNHGLAVYGYPSGNGYWGEPFPEGAPPKPR